MVISSHQVFKYLLVVASLVRLLGIGWKTGKEREIRGSRNLHRLPDSFEVAS